MSWIRKILRILGDFFFFSVSDAQVCMGRQDLGIRGSVAASIRNFINRKFAVHTLTAGLLHITLFLSKKLY